jgi:hypothetical protein
VAGGESHQVAGAHASVCGGKSNQVSGQYGAVGGGVSNQASGAKATIGGGSSNVAAGAQAVSQNGWLLSRRGRSLPANASTLGTHRDSMWECGRRWGAATSTKPAGPVPRWCVP